MGIQSWPILSRESLLRFGKVFELMRTRARSPRTGGEHDFYVLSGCDWCNIIPITARGEVVMIRQFRHGTGAVTLEVPGGMIDAEDASPLEAARRELREETGYAAPIIEPLGRIHPNPAIQSNLCHSFVARDAELVAPPQLDGAEDIEVVLVPLTDVARRIGAGEISHALVVVAFTFLFVPGTAAEI